MGGAACGVRSRDAGGGGQLRREAEGLPASSSGQKGSRAPQKSNISSDSTRIIIPKMKLKTEMMRHMLIILCTLFAILQGLSELARGGRLSCSFQ
eukprot:1099078-Rhodomonas_salina.2